MRSRTSVFVGNLLFIGVCLSAAPFFLLMGYSSWSDYPGWDWPAMLFAFGLVGTVMIPSWRSPSHARYFPGSCAGTE